MFDVFIVGFWHVSYKCQKHGQQVMENGSHNIRFGSAVRSVFVSCLL